MRRAIATTTGLGVATAFLGSGLALITEGAQPEAMSDWRYHNSTGDPRYSDVEGRMTTAINTMYGTDVRVRCADPVEDSKTKLSSAATSLLSGEVSAVSSTQDIWISPTDRRYVRLAPKLCDVITDVESVTPNNPTRFAQTAYAVSALAFQGIHAGYEGEDLNDGVVQCKAIQESGRLAREMGADVPTSIALGKLVAGAEPLASHPEQLPPRNCVDDGPYDIHPNSPGFMPYGGSASYPVPGN
jgi:hypothetical protein